MNIIEAIRDLFRPFFRDLPSWSAWIVLLKAIFALPMADQELDVYRRHTGRQDPPTRQVREGWLVVGRRGGKSRIAALVAVYLAVFRDYSDVLAPGERGTVMVLAADRKQARTVFRYVVAFLEGVPMLKALIVRQTAEEIDLSNGITIEVHTASFRSVRGYSVVAAVLDEIAFWRSEESANPDVEIVNSLRPAMATVPGALLLGISSPYARRGALWEAHRAHFGREGDAVLVWQADTRSMNPAVDPGVIARAYEEDEAVASAEYGAEFRRDLEAFVAREAVEACVVPGRIELPPLPGVRYVAFMDPSGGGQDAFTLGIAHNEKGKSVLDLVRERKGSPERIIEEYAGTLKSYRCGSVVGDRYSAGFMVDAAARFGIRYEHSTRSRSEIYLELLPLVNSEKVEFLDNGKLIAELTRLERRTARSGKDSVDHAPGGHDDLINAAAGALTLTRELGEFLPNLEDILVDTGFRSIGLELEIL